MTAQNYQTKILLSRPSRLIDRPEFFELLTFKTKISVREWLSKNKESTPRRKIVLHLFSEVMEKIFSKDVFVCRFILIEFLI